MNAPASLHAFIDKPERPYPGLRPFRSDEWSRSRRAPGATIPSWC